MTVSESWIRDHGSTKVLNFAIVLCILQVHVFKVANFNGTYDCLLICTRVLVTKS